MWRQLVPALRITLLFTVLTGFIYPGVVTALCQVLFNPQANGSLVQVNGQLVGSSLLGQDFTKPEYFHPRPSSASYDAANSSASNLGPTNKKLIDRVTADAAKYRKDNGNFSGDIPADALTTSASGLDPDISPDNAEAQAGRVAAARGTTVDALRTLLQSNIQERQFGFMGEPRVNVLALNIALDQQFQRK